MSPDLRGLRCPACDYDLTGLREHRCPECGAEFDPDLLRSAAATGNPRITTWLSARFLLVVAASLFLFQMLGLAIAAAPPENRVIPKWLEIVAALAAVPVAVVVQPLVLLISLVELYRAFQVREGRAMRAAGIAAALSFVGLLVLAHLVSSAYH